MNTVVITQLITALFGADPQAQQTPYIDALRDFILSSNNTNLLKGTSDMTDWIAIESLQPAIMLLEKFKFRFCFEGVLDPQNLNLPEELEECSRITYGTSGRSICQLDQILEEMLMEQLKLLKDLPEFFCFLRSTT